MRVPALAALLVACAAASAPGARQPVAEAPPVPELLAPARQLLLVLTPDWNTVGGSLAAFARGDDGAWQEAHWRRGDESVATRSGIPIVVGRNGMAWDAAAAAPPAGAPVKAEGDGRSPAGVFSLGVAFGFVPRAEAPKMALPYTEVTASLECVDDSASRYYNQLVDRGAVVPDWSSSEKMREIGPAYHWGVVVNYNTSPAVPRRGSCIFLHVAGADGGGTAGCTAMAESAMTSLLTWLDPTAHPVLVQMPAPEYRRVMRAWGLPMLPAAH